MRTKTGKCHRVAALVVDDDTTFASSIVEVTDKESAAAWTVEIGDNTAGRTQWKAGITLLVKDFSGIDGGFDGGFDGGTGDKSNAHQSDKEQLVGDHFGV